ncbi:SAM-dependent DNA methyltransferase [Proteus vulgaris]|uniref:SAM-dependent DNA methyltransferase n=1 Tax=Proteus vulgaris TaxID=585 RepID=A0A6G6SQI0_PROVU|nr:SAM-dependent DNA methyltransferase [Proteus vulgaris]QIF95940.1 SAM-dependent DNA methyltransferase [Proteus vulgaris]
MNQLRLRNTNVLKYLELDEDAIDLSVLKDMVDLDSIDSELREYLSIKEMRESGIFFTGSKLAISTVSSFREPITFDSVVLDPTCGAGNLLIACSRQLGVESTLSQTLVKWRKVLRGYDIHQSLVDMTKLRIIVEILCRGVYKDCSIHDALLFLDNVICRNALTLSENELSEVTHVIFNPPFFNSPSPRKNYWKTGNVNIAGVIFDFYLRLLPLKCQVSAILPDVLRSGTRYTDFREFVSRSLQAKCKIWGRFNLKTDVDVFVLSGTIVNNSEQDIKWYKEIEKSSKLSDRYDVRVGPLVPYRDPDEGYEYPYFYPKNCPTWGVVKMNTEVRRFKGTVLKAPFVLVKRTSSPSDKFRAAATLVNIKGFVAVENHMIVITPKSGKLEECKKLMKILKSQSTNNFLNDRARMRHLTVSIIKDIPISEF